jgi:hypothetical protein
MQVSFRKTSIKTHHRDSASTLLRDCCIANAPPKPASSIAGRYFGRSVSPLPAHRVDALSQEEKSITRPYCAA